jgi:DNA-binding GntR family transcriptional regulator
VNVDHDAPTPLYVQVADILRDQISKGTLAGRVPSVATIAQQYEVAKGTAERALAILRDEGLIRSVMGRGHFVVPPAERNLPPSRQPKPFDVALWRNSTASPPRLAEFQSSQPSVVRSALSQPLG